jgi:uncharacterized protein (TIGR00375 family)
VKITASARLTVAGIVEESAGRKGIDVVAIVDAHSPPVHTELEELVASGRLEPLTGGGLRHPGTPALLLILGCEVEVSEEGVGLVHYLSYLPDLETARGFSAFLGPRVTNLCLSSQKARLTGDELALWLRREGGFMVPAHVFTPHKGFFGQGGTDLGHCLSDRALEAVPAVELGLSADTAMAKLVPSLEPFTYLSNSDAHSPETIAREHNVLDLDGALNLDFRSVAAAVREGRVAANYGLDPRLGKYHRVACPRCGHTPEEAGARGGTCPACGAPGMVGGVLDRVMELSRGRPDTTTGGPAEGGRSRPPYVHHIPLRYVPGVGPVAYRALLDRFGTEMKVLRETSPEELAAVIGDRLAARLGAARSGTGRLEITPGAGGRYGRVRPPT